MSAAGRPCRFNLKPGETKVIWEITNACNFGCSYCIFSSKGRPLDGELSAAEAQVLCGQMAQAGVGRVKVTGGEPFLRADCFEILEALERLGIGFDVSTNASLATPEMGCRLAGFGKMEFLHASLDGPDKQSNESVRGGGTFAQTVGGIALLAERGVKVRVGSVVHEFNENRLGELAGLAAELGARSLAFSMMEPAGRMKGKPRKMAKRSEEDLAAEIDGLAKAMEGRIALSRNFGPPLPGQECARAGGCPAGERFAFVDARGMLRACTWLDQKHPGGAAGYDLRSMGFGGALARSRADLQTRFGQGGLACCPVE